MAGYTRQSIADIINGSEVTAPPLNAEFNQMAAAFNGATGHSHDGSTGNSPKINLATSVSGYLPAVNGGFGGKNNFAATTNPLATDDAGDGYAPGSMWENTTTGRVFICVGNTSNAAVWRELVQVQTANKIIPEATDTVDLGEPSTRFQDLWLSGGLSAFGNGSIGGTLTVTGATALSSTLSVAGTTNLNGTTVIGNSTTDTVTVTAKVNSDLIPTGTQDLGSSTDEWNNLFIDGTAKIDTLTVDGSATVASNLTVSGTTNIPNANLTGGSINGVTIGASDHTTGKFTTLQSTGTATLASVDINGGSIDGSTIGASVKAAGSFTTITATGQATLPTVNIDGGSIDGTAIGGSTASSGAFTTVSASGGITGNLSGNVTGNLTGNVTGDITGDLSGDVTGNVTASSGTSTFNNVTINGNLDMDASSVATITNLSTPVNTGDAASKGYVDTSINNLVDGAPAALDTLNELAAALSDDANAYTTLDNKINTKVSKAGDTMTGALNMGSNKVTSSATPSATSDLTNKSYVDAQRDTRLPLSGGTMSGNITMGGNKITATYTPSANADLTTKTYVDGILGSATAASASASAAATSESNAATSETNASNSASAAAASESAAGTSETNASNSASAAATSASNAATSETNAGTSETNASSSASAASNSATAASNSASAASSSASAASASESAAATSETNAAASAVAAAQSETNLNLGPIASTIADTAVDVFVYDTSKDSDGGAWRKRTQGTSWYNETLNTATRGSRKEFPAVAVIVAEATQVTIYDGDDPDLPMWMVFNTSGLLAYTSTVSSVTMLNGLISIGAANGFAEANFLSEEMRFRQTGNDRSQNNISTRNTAALVIKGLYEFIVNSTVNDVAMTVLPNAPIDAATGLPVPTIALATNGGVSVIKDDGSVYDKVATVGSNYNRTYKIAFTSSNDIIYYVDRGYGYRNVLTVIPFGLFNSDYSSFDLAGGRIWGSYPTSYPSGIGTQNNQSTSYSTLSANSSSNVVAAGKSIGLSVFDVQDTEDQSAVSYITSTYNTGWMNGAIKLATLSDTDDTDVTGSELVTNGTFDSDISGWTSFNSSTLSYSSGKLRITNGASLNGGANATITTVVGKKYVVSGEYFAGTSATGQLRVGTTAGGAELAAGPFTAGVQVRTFVATGTTTHINFINSIINGQYGEIDNISVRLAEEDRSVNGKGLQVFGTVTKNPVASGADLVAYSGFSGSNYLEQPYNSDLDFGTGDFCVMGWAKGPSAGNEYILSRTRKGDGANPRLGVRGSSDNSIAFNISGTIYADTGVYVSDQWQQFVFVRKNGTIYGYINGEQKSSQVTSSGSLTLSDSSFFIGIWGTSVGSSSLAFTGSISLVRISATAPSPEQISRIYNDEKHLFTEGAQATLYGSSDAVTALAYDTDTELLHVGTSAGRSVFQGLRRVDNTTTAVTSAISASNGLVADE